VKQCIYFLNINCEYQIQTGADIQLVQSGYANKTWYFRYIQDLTIFSFHQTYLKKEYFPKRYHYANHDRIEDVQLVVDNEWLVGG